MAIPPPDSRNRAHTVFWLMGRRVTRYFTSGAATGGLNKRIHGVFPAPAGASGNCHLAR
jgi:hypothetical protein